MPSASVPPVFFSNADVANMLDPLHDRIWRLGTITLPDAELLAILLAAQSRAAPATNPAVGTASTSGRSKAGPRARAGQPALSTKQSQALAATLLAEIGNVAQISRASASELAPVVGAGLAARVAAAFELGRRAVQLRAHRATIGNADDIYRLAAPRLHGHAQELFLVIGLDIRNGLVDVVEVGRGTAIGVEVHPREVFRPLIRMAAAGAVLAHNHPSGDPTPSSEDLELTRRMREIGQLLGIPVIDHVVIGQNGYRSVLEWAGSDLEPAHCEDHAADTRTSRSPRARTEYKVPLAPSPVAA